MSKLTFLLCCVFFLGCTPSMVLPPDFPEECFDISPSLERAQCLEPYFEQLTLDHSPRYALHLAQQLKEVGKDEAVGNAPRS